MVFIIIYLYSPQMMRMKRRIRMAVLFIPGTAPSYQCLSTDITNGSATGISYQGANVFVIDTGQWYRSYTSGSSFLLAPLPILSGSANSVTLAGSSNLVLSPNPVVNASFIGQITISSSTVNTSGSNYSAITNPGGFLLKPHPSNTVAVWIINTGGNVLAGWPINAGDSDAYFSGSTLAAWDYGIASGSSATLCWKKC
jgi:hypothetical protein